MHKPTGQLAWVHLAGSIVAGALVAAGLVLTGHAGLAFVSGWIATTLVYCLWTWLIVRRMDGEQTEQHSQAEDAGRGSTDLFLTVACLASLVGVGMLLVAGSSKDASGYVHGALGLASVAGSWFTVHLLFTLRYARLFYGDGNRGVDFPQTAQPDYQDFAYLAFCLGMTYQVSDQSITDRTIRHTVARHCLLSYALGAVVLASAINLVVQLASTGG